MVETNQYGFKIDTAKPIKGICCILYCKNKPANGKKYCHKHRKQIEAIRNPIQYSYSNLKQNAKRRGKIFTITIDEFESFVNESGYLEKKGRNKGKFHIDRINPNRGYEIDNIRILECSENVRRRFVPYFQDQVPDDFNPEDLPEVEYFSPEIENNSEDDFPF